MKRLVMATALATGLAFGMQAAGAQTLATIKDRGELVCGGNGTLAGFGLPDPQGNWTGFDVDFCRAIAAAIFNDPAKVKFVPLTAKDRFTALQSGEIDVLSRNTTWTLSRDTSLGLDFAAITYYDGQGFMVRKALKVSSALELSDAAVCVQQGTTSELNLADYFRSNHMGLKTVAFATGEEALKAYESGRGVNKANVDEKLKSDDPETRRLLGVEGQYGEALGLTNDWAYRIIKHVGNFGESFERNVGQGSPLKIVRGLNALWTKGGLQYGPPIR